MRLSIFFFFFSSRRRHTRWNCDWSSDVCSSDLVVAQQVCPQMPRVNVVADVEADGADGRRSEEHTSELQSQFHLVCRLLLEKKKKKRKQTRARGQQAHRQQQQ